MWFGLSGLGGCGFVIWWLCGLMDLVDFGLGFEVLFACLFGTVYLLSYRRCWVVCFVRLGVVACDLVLGLFCVGAFSCGLFVVLAVGFY